MVYDDSGEARSAIVGATSTGSPKRPSGTDATSPARASGAAAAAAPCPSLAYVSQTASPRAARTVAVRATDSRARARPQRPVAAVDQELDVVDPRHVEPVRDRGRGRRRLEQRPEAAAVVDVRMGDHDVAEVGRLEPERPERGTHGRRRRAGDTGVDEQRAARPHHQHDREPPPVERLDQGIDAGCDRRRGRRERWRERGSSGIAA